LKDRRQGLLRFLASHNSRLVLFSRVPQSRR
jgi:hypothetical protein